MDETPIVVHYDVDGRGSRIKGWVDGETEAVITWKGVLGDVTDGPNTDVYESESDALEQLGSIEYFANCELVSAVLRPKGPA